MRICTVHIESITPYSASRKVDEDEHPRLPKEKPDEYDKRVWREHCTVDKDDTVCIPGMGLKMAVDEACKRLGLQVPGRGKTMYTKYFVSGQIVESDVPIGIKKDQLESISIWANADGVRGSGKRVRRYFPYIQEWRGVARFLILDDAIPADVFEKVVREAGQLIGVGRGRPEKGGMNGRFDVAKLVWNEA